MIALFRSLLHRLKSGSGAEKLSRSPVRQVRIKGIRSRLGMAMALALLPFILLGLSQARGEYQRQTFDLKIDLQRVAQRSAHTAATLLNRSDVMLRVLAPEPGSSYCSRRLEMLAAEMEEIDALYKFDKDGRAICASRDVAQLLSSPQRDSDWFSSLQSGQKLASTRIRIEGSGTFMLQAIRIERPMGDFDGAMVAIIPIAILQPQPDNELPTGAQTALFNAQGERIDARPSLAFANDVPGLRDWLSSGERSDDLFQATGSDRIKRYYARSRLSAHDIYAVTTTPAASPWFWARSNPTRFLALPIAAWLTAFAAVMFASERIIIRWLDYLDRIAAIYARGRYTVRPIQADNAPLEIRHLARTLDDLGNNITKRDAALTQALQEKDVLLREIHHRVKNNLQIISSLLSMQQRAVADPSARAVLADTRQRISALALIYRTLYQGEDIRQADASVFLNELVRHLVASETLRGPLVSSHVEADSLAIDPDKLAPMALWLVEAISNAQKHAFAGRGGELQVRFKVNGETSILEVEDDGPGLDTDTPGVGRTLMTAFAKQLRGQAEIVPSPNGGLIARMTFMTPS